MRSLGPLCVIAVVALVCAYATHTAGPATAQQASRPRTVIPDTQQQGDPQKKTLPEAGHESIKIPTEMVQLDVRVVDQDGRPVFNLNKNDFVIFEDKAKQDIESVSREEVPVSTGLVIDTSGSMRTKLRTVSDAALGLIKQMRSEDEMFIAQFKTETELVHDFTSDQYELEGSLKDLYISGGTALLDAIIATADHSQEKGRQRRKAIVVITDGLEKNSTTREKQVTQVMKENEVQLYLVGFLDEIRSGGFFGQGANKKAQDLLLRLSEESGGRAFFPKDIGEMPAIAAEIARDLRMQYVISYYPNNKNHDGAFHTIRVVVNPKDKRKLVARTRLGYYARGEKEIPMGDKERGSNKPSRF